MNDWSEKREMENVDFFYVLCRVFLSYSLANSIEEEYSIRFPAPGEKICKPSPKKEME